MFYLWSPYLLGFPSRSSLRHICTYQLARSGLKIDLFFDCTGSFQARIWFGINTHCFCSCLRYSLEKKILIGKLTGISCIVYFQIWDQCQLNWKNTVQLFDRIICPDRKSWGKKRKNRFQNINPKYTWASDRGSRNTKGEIKALNKISECSR